LSLTNPRNALHDGKWQNLKTVDCDRKHAHYVILLVTLDKAYL